MSRHLAHIAARLYNTPLLLHPGKATLAAQILESRIGIEALALPDNLPADLRTALSAPVDTSRFVGDFAPVDPSKPNGARKPYRTTAEGVAIIPIIGSLVNRGGWLDAMSGIASYERIKFQIGEAAKDDDVRSIILDIDSPGGEAVGAFEVADVVRAAREQKPVAAVVGGLACSAAYAIASAASPIAISPSSLAGSIGVVMLHLDRSRQLDGAGITPTLIHAGARKVDGNPYEKLAPEVRAELQSEIDRFYDLFVEYVVRGRPGLTQQQVRATEARTYIGADAVKVGLADEVGTLGSILPQLPKRAPRELSAAEKRTRYMLDRPRFVQRF